MLNTNEVSNKLLGGILTRTEHTENSRELKYENIRKYDII